MAEVQMFAFCCSCVYLDVSVVDLYKRSSICVVVVPLHSLVVVCVCVCVSNNKIHLSRTRVVMVEC
jgi:hypothetical protein